MNNGSTVVQMLDTNLKLRSMTSNDIEKIISIENTRDDMQWSDRNFLNSLIAGHECWLLELDNNIIAYAVMAIDENESYILNICVAKSERGQGYGTFMMKHMFNIAKENLATVAFLKARASQSSLYNFYKKLGFVPSILLPNYYEISDHKEDARIYVLEF